MPTPVQLDARHDRPLSNIAVAAFSDTQEYIADLLLPPVPVGSESDEYYTIDKAAWLAIHDTRRSRKTPANAIEFEVSSDRYACKNYALRECNAKEDLANADRALQLRETSALNIVEALQRDKELRVANLVTSVSNVGSGVVLSGTSLWSDFVNSSPLSDVTTGHAFIRQSTGLLANTAVIDADTLAVVRRHPELLDLYKYTAGGQLDMSQLAEAFGVERILVGKGVYNQGNLGQSASMANIWGNNLLLAHVRPGVSLKTRTLGLQMRWRPAGIPSDMAVVRYDDPDPGAKAEFVDAGYYGDEKIVGSELGYLINTTL